MHSLFCPSSFCFSLFSVHSPARIGTRFLSILRKIWNTARYMLNLYKTILIHISVNPFRFGNGLRLCQVLSGNEHENNLNVCWKKVRLSSGLHWHRIQRCIQLQLKRLLEKWDVFTYRWQIIFNLVLQFHMQNLFQNHMQYPTFISNKLLNSNFKHFPFHFVCPFYWPHETNWREK